ncbi:MAG: Fe-Mn family superoxide dismutase, partial [Nitrososphaerales archaeon]
ADELEGKRLDSRMEDKMAYEAKNFEHLLGTSGFSDQLLKNHFTLYQGYVTNTNKLAEALAQMVKDGSTGTPEYAELKRRFGWEFNGMRLHEYYFGNMAKGGKALDKGSAFFKKLTEDFGSYENWEKDFKGTGMIRGIGWVVLYYDKMDNRLFNVWINEHDVSHLSGANPILIMDVFEHAFMIDYGLKRADYIEAFFRAIDWSVVASRFDEASKK